MRISAAVCSIVLTAACACAATAEEAWTVADQPDLRTQLDAAKPLATEDLATPARSVMPWGTYTVLNPDGKSWDILQWYIKEYRQKTRVYVTDLGSGEVKLQTFPETEGKIRVEASSWTQALDGKLYGASPDWSQWSTGGAVVIYVYDPALNEVKEFTRIPGVGGERHDLSLGPDGLLYGAGTFLAKDNPDNGLRAAAYQLDPKTGKVRNYGPIGPSHKPYGCYGYWMGVDDEYIYVASGKLPWWLVAVNIKTGEQKVLLEAPPGDYPHRMRIWDRWPGAYCWVNRAELNDLKEYTGGRYYWLWHGEAIAMPEDANPMAGKMPEPPWPKTASPFADRPPRPQCYGGQLDPDADGNATLWYRFGAGAWTPVTLKDVETYPLRIHRLVPLPDGRIFGTAQGYQGRFLFDPKTDKATVLGRGGCSIYCLAVIGDRLYWSGYSSAPVEVLDWTKPWTLGKGGPPNEPPPSFTSEKSNPRHVGGTGVFNCTRVKKMQSAAVGADGVFYIGGIGQRDYTGGGLGWYDPKDGSTGGMWRPFSGHPVYWVTPVHEARQLVVSTRCGKDELNDNKAPESGKVFVFDVAKREILRDIIPVDKAAKAGPLVEVAPGRCLGITDDPEVAGGGVIYGLDIDAGAVLFRKKAPYALAFRWGQGTAQWDFAKGPDGKVYTFLKNVLVRIAPGDGRVEVLGTLPGPARFCFVGNDLYLAGAEPIRRLKGVAAR